MEAGIKHDLTSILPFVKDLETATKLMKCSPIHKVDKVLAATLLLLGSEDVRVPICLGMAYYRALKAANKTAEYVIICFAFVFSDFCITFLYELILSGLISLLIGLYRIRLYNDCHPLMKVSCRFDAAIHSVLWFAKHLKNVSGP